MPDAIPISHPAAIRAVENDSDMLLTAEAPNAKEVLIPEVKIWKPPEHNEKMPDRPQPRMISLRPVFFLVLLSSFSSTEPARRISAAARPSG